MIIDIILLYNWYTGKHIGIYSTHTLNIRISTYGKYKAKQFCVDGVMKKFSNWEIEPNELKSIYIKGKGALKELYLDMALDSCLT